MGDAYQLRKEDLQSLDKVDRPLNDILRDIGSRLDDAETFKHGFVTLEFRTAATPASTFPMKVPPPRTVSAPQGVKVVMVTNVDAPNVQITSSVFPHVRIETDGTLTVLNITGLSGNTRYRIVLEVVGNA